MDWDLWCFEDLEEKDDLNNYSVNEWQWLTEVVVEQLHTALQDILIVVFTLWLDAVLLTCLFADFAIGRM